MGDPKLPRGAVQAILDAIEADGWLVIGMDAAVRAGLLAAWPAIERHVRREMAREILALDAAEHALFRSGVRNVGPYGDAVTSLRRLAQGKPLPAVAELRGGQGAQLEESCP